MTDRLLAIYPAMTRVAAAQRGSRNELIRIQQARREAGLAPESLGRILPARDIVRTFGEADSATRAGLWDLAHRCEDLRDAIREARNVFRVVDEDAARRFEALGDAVSEAGR